MSDTQWPRYEVFHQEAPDRPHRHAGSVHAPDAEMALLNARDVFVRRPECSSLWVAPAASIVAGSAEKTDGEAQPVEANAGAAVYLVFAKLEPRGTLTHVGQVEAGTAGEALQEAARAWGPAAPHVLWVIPVGSVTGSEPDESDPFFAPARDRPYRDQAFYHVQTALRRLRREGGG
jgi:ring-1,2-phenylacetyl-CoA epoxidase subunit PaaB